MVWKYGELTPTELDRRWEASPIAVVPFGALEWHGDHLPLGLDSMVAEWFAHELSERLEAVLLPLFTTPVTTLPHRHSLQIRTEGFRILVDDLLAGLYRSGARKVALVTGHYAQGHMVELYEAALRAMDDFEGLAVHAASPLELLANDNLLDHAARYETSQLLAICPEFVHLERLEEGPGSAVLGESPHLASATEGEELLLAALSRWQEWVSRGDMSGLREFYRGRFDAYEPYIVQYYRGSWEEAILLWWHARMDKG